MKTKNWCRPRMLFVRYKFRHIEHNNTTLRTPHFFNLSLVRVWHLLMSQKMTQCQIFIAQTALVHYVLLEICISYLYTYDTLYDKRLLMSEQANSYLSIIKNVLMIFKFPSCFLTWTVYYFMYFIQNFINSSCNCFLS